MEFDWENPPHELDSSLSQREIEESFEDPFAVKLLPDSRRFAVQARFFNLGMSAQALWEQYTCFGEDPFILSVDVTPVHFSAWDYARERCAQLCPMRQEELFQDRSEDSPASPPAPAVKPRLP